MRKNKGLVTILCAALILGGVGYMSNGFKDWNADNWRNRVIPSQSSEVVDDSSEATPDISEDPELGTSSEPEPIDFLENLTVKGPFENVSWMNHVLNFESDNNIAPLVQTAYRNSDSHGKLTNKNRDYIFNSAKMGKNYEANGLAVQLGFPTTLNETHYEKFGLSNLNKKYTSYLVFDYKVKNDTGFEIRPNDSKFYKNEDLIEFSDADIHLIYKTNESPNWNYIELGNTDLVVVPADDLFYQFAIVFNTGNKSNNVVIGFFDMISSPPILED